MSMKPIQIPSVPINPHELLDHHQVVTWTLKCSRWNQTTKKLISPRFDILNSVRIDNLLHFCYVFIVLTKCELITCQLFVLFDSLDSVIIDNFPNACSVFIVSDEEEKK